MTRSALLCFCCHFLISTNVEMGRIDVLHRKTWYGESNHMSTIIRRCFLKRNYIYPAVFWFCFIIQCPSDWGIFTDAIYKDKQAIHAGKCWVNHEHQTLRCIVIMNNWSGILCYHPIIAPILLYFSLHFNWIRYLWPKRLCPYIYSTSVNTTAYFSSLCLMVIVNWSNLCRHWWPALCTCI